MQPNFSFEPITGPNLAADPKPALRRPAAPAGAEKPAAKDSAAHPDRESFRSTLRDASRKQEDSTVGRPARGDKKDVENPDEDARPQECDPGRAAAAAEDGSAETDVRSTAPRDPSIDPAQESANGSEPPGEKTADGSAEAKLTAVPSERGDAAEMISAGESTGDAVPANAGRKPAEPVDAQVAGAGIGVQKSAHAPAESAERAPVGLSPANGRPPAVESAGDGKNQSSPDPKPSGDAGYVSADAKKTAGEASHADRPSGNINPSTAEGKADAGSRFQAAAAGAARNVNDAGGGESAHPLQKMPPGQEASGPKSSMPVTPQPAETPAARAVDLSAEQQVAGRMQGDLQHSAENDGRSNPGGSEDNLHGPARVSAGAKDGAFMQHQDQSFERLMEPAVPPRDKEALPGAVRAHTLDQIVDKAVYQLKGGQNSIRIDLKPEFLGQVRMQIVTVDHQVSVRITADLPLVREMLETNLQQLKADLQQQGLMVDKIEISMSADSQRHTQNRKTRSGPGSRLKSIEAGDAEPVLEASLASTAHTTAVRGAVDMFV